MKIACTEHRDEDCARRVRNVLDQDPTNYEALFQDGLLSFDKEDAANAVRAFEFLSNIYRRNPLVRYQLAVALLRSAKDQSPANARTATDAAESRLSEAIDIDPRFEQAVLLFAQLKIPRGAAGAIRALQQVLRDRPQSAEANYLLASAYLAQQQRQAALRVYRRMTEFLPKAPQPWFLMARVLADEKEPAEARKALEKSLEIDPDYGPATERLVDLDIAGKQYSRALNRVQKLIDKDAKSAPAWGLRGKIYAAQRDFARAEPDLLKAIDLDPQLEPAYLLLAQLYVATNKQDEAVAKLNAFVQQRKDVRALMGLAAIEQQRKNYPAARDAYEQLLTVLPDSLPVLSNLALLYSEQLGDLDKAYDLARKARDVAPTQPQVADTLGWVLFKKRDYANALPFLQEAARASDVPAVIFHLGMTHYMLGQEEAARAALQKAVNAGPDFPEKDDARARLAVLAIKPGAGGAGARVELDKYLGPHPNDPAALTRLAAFEERDGKLNEAIKTYENIVAEDPLYAPAVRQLALLYAGLPADIDTTKPYDLALRAIEAYPGDAELVKILGILNYRRKLYPRSLQLLTEAFGKRKDDPELLYYLGETHYQLRDWSRCKATLEQAVSLNLPAGLAEEATRTLAQCSDNIPPAQP
jgi:tetratricopeptide (TPR) repeat protein